MSESLETYRNPELAERRLLTEPDHFLDYMDDQLNVPEWVFRDVAQNRSTASCEIAMPDAVTTTLHEVEYRMEEGRRRRVIVWMGYTATQMAEGGRLFHFSAPAFDRVDIEVPAAGFVEENLRPGVAQPFVSPAMTRADASLALARAEHLGDDDSLQVSTAVTNRHGEVTHRKFQSLLVCGIPFPAWVAMFKDPGNIFGRSLPLRDEIHATSVMELFAQMELPVEMLPEGPISLVAAVLPYVQRIDQKAYESVSEQLVRFRTRQEFYAKEAERAGVEWAQFDLELARSLRTGVATDALRFFILQNGHDWSEESLRILNAHELDDAVYTVDRELAALLARAKQKLLGDKLCVVTDNEAAIEGVDQDVRDQIKINHNSIAQIYNEGYDLGRIRQLEAQQYALLHQQVIRSGGGCSGNVKTAFNELQRHGLNELGGVGENDNPFKSAESSAKWTWKPGNCRVKKCPSPKPTEVGPCSVCRHCQREFDAGRDPTK